MIRLGFTFQAAFQTSPHELLVVRMYQFRDFLWRKGQKLLNGVSGDLDQGPVGKDDAGILQYNDSLERFFDQLSVFLLALHQLCFRFLPLGDIRQRSLYSDDAVFFENRPA